MGIPVIQFSCGHYLSWVGLFWWCSVFNVLNNFTHAPIISEPNKLGFMKLSWDGVISLVCY